MGFQVTYSASVDNGLVPVRLYPSITIIDITIIRVTVVVSRIRSSVAASALVRPVGAVRVPNFKQLPYTLGRRK